MPNLIDYIIENRELRNRFIDFIGPFAVVSGTLLCIAMLTVKYFR
ncbi:hypothetical protein [Paraburkholderia lacunae]|nr:hypothetical protein [Paraburkholderia lacunae]